MDQSVLKQLLFACEKNDLETVKKLVPSEISGDGPNGQVSPLHICAEKGYTEIGEYLLTCGKASVKRRDKYTNSPIHYAAKHGQARFIQMLLKFRCDVNVRGLQFMTPLHLAAEGNHASAFQILLMNKADLFRENKNKKTPLEFSISSEFYGSNDAVNPLILKTLFKQFPEETRQRINDVYHKGWPHNRFHNSEVYDVLREHMPDYLHLVLLYISQLTMPHLDEMLDMGWDVKLLNQVGETTIHAAIHCYTRRMKELFNMKMKNPLLWTDEVEPYICRLQSLGAEVNHRNTDGETAFLLLCKENDKIEQEDPYLKMMEFGANVHIGDNNGIFPLELLIIGVKPKCIGQVLKSGVDINNKFVASCKSLLKAFDNVKEKECLNCLQMKYLLTAGLRGLNSMTRTLPQHQIESFERTVLKHKDIAILIHACGYRFSYMNDNNGLSLSEVNTLRNMAARNVCENLYPNAWVSVEKLEMPTSLKKLITFNHYEFEV